MSALFPPWTNTAARVALLCVFGGLFSAVALLWLYVRSPLFLLQHEAIEQPRPRRHRQRSAGGEPRRAADEDRGQPRRPLQPGRRTEILLFGGLFVGYIVYRYLFPMSFKAASGELGAVAGAVDTLVLLTSSLTAVLSLHFLRVGRLGMMQLMLAATMAFGMAFLVIHGFEYRQDYLEGHLPGRYLADPELASLADVIWIFLFPLLYLV